MTRFARARRVLFWEEPISAPAEAQPSLIEKVCDKSGVVVLTPAIPEHIQGIERERALRGLLDARVADLKGDLVRWYYTPMMLAFSRHLDAVCTVYDCMDELKNFRFAPPELARLEKELLAGADVVFTGGYSLYEAKRGDHPNIHPFPSSVDRAHFEQARRIAVDPEDQIGLPHPRFGFYGVIDERMDLDLLAALADARPDWQLIMVGPVVKISPEDLPKRPNIAYLGGKTYAELPCYLAGWDVAMMPFAINESTRFISPTKTPEYLAAGKPVVSTPITDVIRHYGDLEGVKIAGNVPDFIARCEQVLALPREGAWLTEVDKVLSELSWDETFRRMDSEISKVVDKARAGAPANETVVSFRSQMPAIRPASRSKPYDYLIVGAGFAGSVLAERLATQLRKRVLLIDRRMHIGGNAFDEKDHAGVLMHRYGPHIFHTNSEDIARYLSKFTQWRPYEHRVLADIKGILAPIPINRTTLNLLYGLNLTTDEEAEAYLAGRAEPVETVRTSEDVVVSKVGRELYETFFRGYTRKQWGLDPSQLDKSVTARVPTRTNTDDRYFADSFQAMPAYGYTRMFQNMLAHVNIDIVVGVDWEDLRGEAVYDNLIFTGPVDEYFDHRYGPLPYRSLEFKHQTIDREWFQPVGTVNYPSEAVPYTRISEYKHITGQSCPKTTITYEFPRADGDPYYPVPRPENQALYKKYEALALAERDVAFVG
ncbi:MAG TPA: UDP-galactopyranose mutase, partial [Caulobacteraceae bacterium]|nr:UDP-galactopyranose mutase [Caulobacteraceae bacterium]